MDEVCMEHSAHARAIRKHDERLDAHGRQLDTLAETLAALKEIERQNQERIDAPDGMKPDSTCYFAGSSLSGNIAVNVRIEPDGLISVVCEGKTVGYWTFSACFPAA